MLDIFKAEKGFRIMAEEIKLFATPYSVDASRIASSIIANQAKVDKGGHTMGIIAKNYTVEELKALGIEAKPDYIRGGFRVSSFSKDYTVEELEALGFEVEGDPKEVPLFNQEEYQEAREEMGEDFIEMEKIDDYIEPDYYHNGTDGVDTIEMLYRTIPFEQFRGFMKGNVIKYVTRYDRKNGQEDLIKAHTYLDRLRDYEEQHGFAKRLDEEGEEA